MKSVISNEYGHCHYCVCEDENCSMLYNLFIAEEYRRKGNAKHLVQKAIDEIRATGYKGDIRIVPEPEDNSISKEDLIEFYKKMGLIIIQI